MKKLNTAGIAVCMLLTLSAEPLSAQVAKGVVLTAPQPVETSVSTSLEPSTETGFSSARAFRNDSFLTVRPKVDEVKIGNSEIKLSPVFHILSEDYDRYYEDADKYKKESMLKTFMDSMNEELQSDPFYHIGREIDTSVFIYEEKSWDALASTLKKRYEFVRKADKITKDLEKSVTLTYKAADGMSAKLRPGIDRIDGDYSAQVRCTIKNIAGIERVETRVGEDCFKLRFACHLNRKQNSQLAVEYESILERDENDQKQRNEISQVVVEIPFW